MSNPGYYTEFRLPPWFEVPDSLRRLLETAFAQRYEELYEKVDGPQGGPTLRGTLDELVDALWGQGGGTGHRRFVYLGLALALASRPTMERHEPGNPGPAAAIARSRTWLERPGEFQEVDREAVLPEKWSGSQARDEAVLVFRAHWPLLDPAQARDALLQMLDLCLEGYAVFPGSDGRRDLFDWLLVEAVPAAWCLRLPEAIYSREGPWPPDPRYGPGAARQASAPSGGLSEGCPA
jgi:hypothetical protein